MLHFQGKHCQPAIKTDHHSQGEMQFCTTDEHEDSIRINDHCFKKSLKQTLKNATYISLTSAKG